MENEKYFKEILKRFDKQVKVLKSAKTPNDISTCEREIAPIMNELQMALPRLGDDIFKAARDRRKELLEGK